MNARGRIFGAGAWVAVLFAAPVGQPADPPPADTSTLREKVLCGYQGWFRCPGDGTPRGWRHWSRDARRLAPDTLTVEMWPDTTEYGADELFPAPGFTLADGTPARLFSSANAATVDRHFRWMREYGIDGAFVQRFLVELGDPSANAVLGHCRAAAAKHGRGWAVCYDLSGVRADKVFDALTADWKRLVDRDRVTADPRYLRHAGKPVAFVWGLYPDRFGPDLAHKLLDFFQADPASPYAAAVVGGTPWHWRKEANAEWARAFRRLDAVSPWNVGNVTTERGERHAATGYWKDDVAEAKRAGMLYLPVAYPGFAWTNLKGPAAAKDTLPRLGGRFYWRQFAAAAGLGLDAVYVAMFDEVDEGTAVFKVTNRPPTEASFATLDGLPSDWYLRLTGEGRKLLRGERPASVELPIRP